MPEKNNPPYQIRNQKISPELQVAARKLRQNMTPAEQALWKHLRGNRLSGLPFRRQQIIEGFIVDFYCHQAGIVIEVDGEIHQYQKVYDKVRQNELEALGLKVLRFSNQEVIDHLENALDCIARDCLELIEKRKDNL